MAEKGENACFYRVILCQIYGPYVTPQDRFHVQMRSMEEHVSKDNPAGSTLTTSGTWHQKTRERDSYQFKKYRTPDCNACAVKHLCTGRASGGREIERSQYAEAVELNGRNYHTNKELYRKRQEMNEHILGTIKRQWGYNHTNLRGIAKVNGEMALNMTVYNIKRAMNILGIEKLMEKLKTWNPDYPKATISQRKRAILSPNNEAYF